MTSMQDRRHSPRPMLTLPSYSEFVTPEFRARAILAGMGDLRPKILVLDTDRVRLEWPTGTVETLTWSEMTRLKEKVCARDGHRWEILCNPADQPTAVYCSFCGTDFADHEDQS